MPVLHHWCRNLPIVSRDCLALPLCCASLGNDGGGAALYKQLVNLTPNRIRVTSGHMNEAPDTVKAEPTPHGPCPHRPVPNPCVARPHRCFLLGCVQSRTPLAAATSRQSPLLSDGSSHWPTRGRPCLEFVDARPARRSESDVWRCASCPSLTTGALLQPPGRGWRRNWWSARPRYDYARRLAPRGPPTRARWSCMLAARGW